jgi:SAM-dependent methyltransferase
MGNMSLFLSGQKLYGDDLSLSEIQDWYNDEKEGYAELGAKNKDHYQYGYHNVNKLHGFKYLPDNMKFDRVLGLGAAYGEEFLPIINKIGELHIIEPSEQLVSNKLGNISPIYHQPSLSGKIDFPDNHFDLITCLSTLHHIPNVSFVLRELHRCLKPNGILLMKEPISTMGDWRKPRPGLTKHERGIPLKLFREILHELDFKIIKESFCFSMTAFICKLLKRPVYKNKLYLKVDKFLSMLLKSRAYRYHRVGFFSKIAPGSVYYVLRK